MNPPSRHLLSNFHIFKHFPCRFNARIAPIFPLPNSITVPAAGHVGIWPSIGRKMFRSFRFSIKMQICNGGEMVWWKFGQRATVFLIKIRSVIYNGGKWLVGNWGREAGEKCFAPTTWFRVMDRSGRQGLSSGEPATGEAATNEATAADGRPGDEPLTTSG